MAVMRWPRTERDRKICATIARTISTTTLTGMGPILPWPSQAEEPGIATGRRLVMKSARPAMADEVPARHDEAS